MNSASQSVLRSPATYASLSQASVDAIRCNWKHFRAQMLLQWKRLSAAQLDEAGPSRARIAGLIERTYGIASDLVENYLRNFERTMLAHPKQ